jgi:protein-S-isoprenylcysteine O-methyltransferase Ste14
LGCAIYSTIPAFWLMVHPFAERWRTRHVSDRRTPYLVLVPAWLAMWAIVIFATRPWRQVALYSSVWAWFAAAVLFAAGIALYAASRKGFTAKQLGGIPELHVAHSEQRLAVNGIRAHMRHPVYLAHLCEMLAWSIGTGLVVCWALTAFAIVTGALMIPMEDAELEKRFGDRFRTYRSSVPAVLPRVFRPPQL